MGEEALRALPQQVTKMNTILQRDFNYGSLDEMERSFRDELTKAEGVPNENERLTKLHSIVSRDEMNGTLRILDSLKTWLRVQVPQIEDGNNFGVAVQGDVQKAVAEEYTALLTALGELPSYHATRASAWEKVGRRTSKEKKVSRGSSTEKGGKDGNVAKDTTSTSEEESSTEASFSPDAFLRIVAIDVTAYVTLHHALLGARNGLAVAGDMIEKNMEKIVRPKGNGNASGAMFAF
ncbi:unnamed protein product [Discosporangium mesarthrocarpum]